MQNRCPLDVRVHIGTDPTSLTPTTLISDAAAGAVIEDTLGGLAADTEYYYRIDYRPAPRGNDGDFRTYRADSTDTGTYSFHTARDTGEVFVFTVQADSHLPELYSDFGPEVYRQTLANILTDSADFHFTLGDFVNTDGFRVGGDPETYEAVYGMNLDQRTEIADIAVEMPFLFTLGNHEAELGWESAESSAVWSARARLALWPNPQADDDFYSGDTTQTACCGRRESYYSFRWGDALFAVLDPYWYTTENPRAPGDYDAWRWTLGADQYNWLYDTLQDTTALWKIVFSHQLVGGNWSPSPYGRGGIEFAPYFEWGGHDTTGADVFATERPGWTHGPIHDMLDTADVDIVFFGHDHTYAYQALDGVVYHHVAQASDVTYGVGLRNNGGYADSNSTFVNNSGHLRVTVCPDSVFVEYVRSVLAADEPLVEGADSVYNQTVSHTYTLYP